MAGNVTDALAEFSKTTQRTTPAMPAGPARPEPVPSGIDVAAALADHAARHRIELPHPAPGPQRPD